jgi:hypothetical protein
MNKPDILSALESVVKAFEKSGIAYYISGSVASSVYGIARATLDVDLVADITYGQVNTLVQLLKSDYYIDEEMISDAIRNQASFNLIHFKTMLKIDVFILKNTTYDRLAFQRKRKDTIDTEGEQEFHIASAEDIILNKLQWYIMGGKVSERQWMDILGVLKVQGNLIDFNYLQHWAEELKMTELLNEAIESAK